MPPLAHPGHWVADLLYIAPLALMGVVVLVGRIRARRAQRERRPGRPTGGG